MVKSLTIKNFKSIRDLKIGCKRVNIFIGRPNMGKSNILEGIGILSFPYLHKEHLNLNLRNIVRFSDMTNLFYDNDLSQKIEIQADSTNLEVKYENDEFKGVCIDGKEELFRFHFDYNSQGRVSVAQIFPPFRFYRFEAMNTFKARITECLLPPRGDNLMYLLLINKNLRNLVADIFREYELRIVLKPQESKIEVQKEVEDVIIAYPYFTVSDTLQRIIFYLVAVETNKNSVIVFEEPESHAFPYYTKFLAERIALDTSNQYFISTHNPYLLLSLLEKTPKKDIGIFITYLKDFQTKVRLIEEEKQLSEFLDLDVSVFFNIDKFLEK